jgi:GNAT superfamily N-acetyltransferase
MSDSLAIRAIPEGPDWPAAYALVRQLRPALSEAEFTARARAAAAADGYTLYGAFDGPACVGVLGLRRLVDLLHGPHLYIDDLVVAEGVRSRGVGAALLRFAESLGAEAGVGLRLCTGIDHWPARRFYEREGWAARAVAYKKGFPA